MCVGGGKAELHSGEAATAAHGRTECKAGGTEDCSCSHEEIGGRDPPAQGEPQESSAGERRIPEDGSEQEVSYSVGCRRKSLPSHLPLVPSHIHICIFLVSSI
jgi:hypothetical protein